jgi:hypothetical protein
MPVELTDIPRWLAVLSSSGISTAGPNVPSGSRLLTKMSVPDGRFLLNGLFLVLIWHDADRTHETCPVRARAHGARHDVEFNVHLSAKPPSIGDHAI